MFCLSKNFITHAHTGFKILHNIIVTVFGIKISTTKKNVDRIVTFIYCPLTMCTIIEKDIRNPIFTGILAIINALASEDTDDCNVGQQG